MPAGPTTETAGRTTAVAEAYALDGGRVLAVTHSGAHGLDDAQAATRLRETGPNTLPRSPPPGLPALFLQQFASPLIYVLLAAVVVSLATRQGGDAAFIAIVVLVNAVIGSLQEHAAQRTAAALARLIASTARVLRGGVPVELESSRLVPGDVVLLEPGARVAADMRLLTGHELRVDESLLTGESLPVEKTPACVCPVETPLAERVNMAFAGTLVDAGHGRGVVTATGGSTELGRIAGAVTGRRPTKPPLLARMERLASGISVAMLAAIVVVGVVSLARGTPLQEVFFVAVALAVAAIPEGLPVAITVALSISMRRMSRRGVVVRKLVAVESLGSCTCIAADKTGTLTVNELTVERVLLPDGTSMEVTRGGVDAGTGRAALERLARAAVLTNDAHLAAGAGGDWTAYGDKVDAALLVMAHKAGLDPQAVRALPVRHELPYESARAYSASMRTLDGRVVAFVKGAPERVFEMCAHAPGDEKLDRARVQGQVHMLAQQGYRVLALAEGAVADTDGAGAAVALEGLTLLGLVGMRDPLRPGAREAVARCARAGVRVCMLTGDHPATAAAIARELGLLDDDGEVVMPHALAEARASGTAAFDALVERGRVFARVDPEHKLEIVRALARAGHFVAVTGDGANDAPALRSAHVGCAMGRSGTDVARETADLVLTDDDFSSIVAGIEEGRIAYANVRKVVSLLLGTGAAEIVLFVLTLATGLPLPLTAVQLLWLNLVTNGIQHVGLAAEPGEGDELMRPPRPPGEPIFNRLMTRRVALAGAVIGTLAFGAYAWLLARGWNGEEARNLTLLLMVLFENVQVLNCRSETRTAFTGRIFRNPLLVGGTCAAQLVHLGAMYTPGLRDVLAIAPVGPGEWLATLGLASLLLFVVDADKRLVHATATTR